MLHFDYGNKDVQVIQKSVSGYITNVGWIDSEGRFWCRFGHIVELTDLEKEQLISECKKISERNTISEEPTHTPTNPAHYKFTLDGKEYDIDQVIVALGLPWRLANAMKYIARAGKKDDEKQDISKAITYLQRHIQ